jgi:hypothetical protein
VIEISEQAHIYNLNNFPQGTFYCLDLNKTFIPDHWDYIVSMHTFEHLDNPVELLNKCINQTKREVIINVPFDTFKNIDVIHTYKFNLNGPWNNYNKYLLIQKDSSIELTEDASSAEEIYYIFEGKCNVDR